MSTPTPEQIALRKAMEESLVYRAPRVPAKPSLWQRIKRWFA